MFLSPKYAPTPAIPPLHAVAAYIAKYATKGAETATGTLDRPIHFLAELAHVQLSDHARRMIRTAWTLGALRTARADYRRAQSRQEEPEDTTYVLSHWTFAGTGLTRAETWLATTVEPAPGTEGEPTT